MAAGKITHGYIENHFEQDMIGRLGRLTRKDLKGVAPIGRDYPLVYICSPYASAPALNTALAKDYCRYAISKKVQPIAPHLIYPLFMDDKDAMEREKGLSFGINLMRLCTEVWVFRPHGGVSSGMEAEIKEALRLRIPVVYINDPAAYGEKEGWDPIKSYDERQTKKRGRPSKQTEGR